MKSLLLLVVCLGCGGTGKDGPTTPGSNAGSGAGKPAAAGDVSLELPVIKLDGLVFEPEALGRPGMPLYQPKNARLTTAQQKVIFGKANNALEKQAQGAVLATMIYLDSKKKTGDDAKKLVEEARQVLRTAAAAAGGKP
ncbi:MAG: hypothetical protein H0V17_13325, partial [Deltaproteobacteria bacterium]|nr:hypothetical protein [Deltaproteobacteria bacterium]